MRPHLPQNALLIPLRQCYTTQRCQLQTRPQTRRLHATRPCQRLPQMCSAVQLRGLQKHEGDLEDTNYSTKAQFVSSAKRCSAPNSDQKHIAILGGGITGLSAAHYLTRELPNAKITIYEASPKVGGWLQSKSVDVGNGNVVFESGPRTLRPRTVSGMVTIEMIDDLDLEKQLLVTPLDSVAASNRFVYYPDHLVRMPGPGGELYSDLWKLFTEPVFAGWATSLLEFNRPRRATWSQYQNPDVDDESVGSFLERRTGGPNIGNNLVSAVLHGIYAGDINQLSARSLMPQVWWAESFFGSYTMAAIQRLSGKGRMQPYNDVMLQEELRPKISQHLNTLMANASVYTFKQGIGTLVNALEKSLRANQNVDFKVEHEVKSLHSDAQTSDISITTIKTMPPQKYTNVISTLFSKTLSKIANVPALASMHAVTVMVVNLYFTDPDILPERGFGYLIPRSIPFEQNPECALGVIFDSDSTAGQDTATGTKVTVMLGGHWWDGMDSYPDEEEAAAMAQAILQRHLNISQQPKIIHASLQRNCIPQYNVGHEAKMKKAHTELFDGYKGRLHVAGNSYTGVGLNDCVRAARDVAMKLKNGDEFTGLDGFAIPKVWAEVTVK